MFILNGQNKGHKCFFDIQIEMGAANKTLTILEEWIKQLRLIC